MRSSADTSNVNQKHLETWVRLFVARSFFVGLSEPFVRTVRRFAAAAFAAAGRVASVKEVWASGSFKHRYRTPSKRRLMTDRAPGQFDIRGDQGEQGHVLVSILHQRVQGDGEVLVGCAR